MAAPDLTDFDTEEKQRLAIPTSAFDGRSLIASAPAVDLNALPPGPEMLTRLMQSDPHAAAGLPSPGAPEPAALMPPPAAPVTPAAPSKPILDTKSTATTSEKLSDVQKQDFAQLDKIKGQELAAQDKLTADNQKDAALEAQAAQAKQLQAEQAAAAKAQAVADAQARRAQAEATYQQKLEAFNGKEFHSYWSGRPAAAEILADIGVALGAFGASGRGQNEALQILNGRIEQDFNLQRAQIEKAKDSVIMAKTGVADADQARAIALDDLEIKRNAATQAIEARLLAGKTAQLGDRAAAEGELKKAGFAKDIQDRKERTTAGMATRTTSTSNFVNPDAIELKSEARRAAAKGGKDDETGIVNVGRDAQGLPIIIGKAVAGRGGPLAIAQQDIKLTQSADALRAMIADVKANGETPKSPSAIARRQGLEADVKKAMASVSNLGKSDEAIDVEGASAGVHGPLRNMFQGANLESLQHQLEIAEKNQQNHRDQTTIPLTPEERAKFSARHATDTRDVTSVSQGGTPERKPPGADLLSQARDILNDPAAPKEVRDRARSILLQERAAR